MSWTTYNNNSTSGTYYTISYSTNSWGTPHYTVKNKPQKNINFLHLLKKEEW